MSKRYVIQVNGNPDLNADPRWVNVQHPAGGDWLTRSRSTAIADAAKLVQAGETRELRVMLSLPVYQLQDAGVGNAEIVAASKEMHNPYLNPVDDDDDDYDDDDDDDELTEVLEAQVGNVPDAGEFEIVNEDDK